MPISPNKRTPAGFSLNSRGSQPPGKRSNNIFYPGGVAPFRGNTFPEIAITNRMQFAIRTNLRTNLNPGKHYGITVTFSRM